MIDPIAPAAGIELHFADGDYQFHLTHEGMTELEEKCGVGIGSVRARVGAGRYVFTGSGAPHGNADEARFHIQDIYHTVRLGLIGGGGGVVDGRPVKVDPQNAKTLAERYVLSRPLAEGWSIAFAVLLARIDGFGPGVNPGHAVPTLNDPKSTADTPEAQGEG